jgi:L-amino acid N-acyltransferase YncA
MAAEGRVPKKPALYRPRRLVLRDGREVTLRAITESDAPAIQRAFDRLSSDSRYTRFLHHKKLLSPAALARGVHPLPGRDFVFVATVPRPGGVDVVGAAQYVRETPADDSTCEFAMTVAEDWRGSGLARQLLASLLRRARRDHYAVMIGLVLAGNTSMLELARKLKFSVEPSSEGGTVVRVTRRLAVPLPAPPPASTERPAASGGC